jgi:hypothetical protein
LKKQIGVKPRLQPKPKKDLQADRRHAESVAKADRQNEEAKKRLAELERVVLEQTKQIDKQTIQIQEQSKMINGISNSNGKFAEDAFFSSLKKDKTFAGIKFDTVEPNLNRSSKAHRLKGEYDAVMIGAGTVALIEVKYTVREKDVEDLYTRQLENCIAP